MCRVLYVRHFIRLLVLQEDVVVPPVDVSPEHSLKCAFALIAVINCEIAVILRRLFISTLDLCHIGSGVGIRALLMSLIAYRSVFKQEARSKQIENEEDLKL